MLPENEIVLYNHLQFFSLSLLLYDHALTFPSELRVIWRRPQGKGAWLFLLNRYLALFGNIPNLALSFVALSASGCAHYLLIRQCLLVLSVVVACCILTARTYALYNRSKKILAIILSWGAVLFAIACWALFGPYKDTAPTPVFAGCHTATSTISATHTAVAWECLVAFDSLIVILTLLRGRSLTRRIGQNNSWALTQSRKLDLGTLIMRDGVLYYAVVALANLANVVTFYAAPPLLRGVLSSPASVIAVTMCARLMLNVHESAQAQLLPSRSSSDGAGRDAVLTSHLALEDDSTFGAGEYVATYGEVADEVGNGASHATRWPNTKQAFELQDLSLGRPTHAGLVS